MLGRNAISCLPICSKHVVKEKEVCSKHAMKEVVEGGGRIATY